MSESSRIELPEAVREIIRAAEASQRAISEGRIKQDGDRLMAVFSEIFHEQHRHPVEELECQFI